jgi:hypothetical protein
MREFRIAVVAFQDPFGHQYRPYRARNLLKIPEIIYLPLVLSGRQRTKRSSENGIENRFFRAVYFRKFPRPQGQKEWLMDQTNYLWHAAYMAVVYETDDSLMPGRILEALSAIEQRLLAPSEIDTEEFKAIQNAQDGLQALKAERAANMQHSGYERDLNPEQSSA